MKERFNVLRDKIHSSFQGILSKWLLLVAINAAPSLWVALVEGYNLGAMLVAIFCFTIFYARLEWYWRQSNQRFPLLLSILNIGVTLRCLFLVPLLSLDWFSGVLAIQAVESSLQALSLGKSIPFLSTFLITMLQGVLLSLILLLLGSFAVAIYRLVTSIRQSNYS